MTTPSLRTLIEGADLAPLLMMYVQLSGDRAELARYRPHIRGPWRWMEDAPPALRARLHERSAELLEAIASGRAQAAPPPAPDLLAEMVNTCVGQAVPDEYLPLIAHEMGLAGTPLLEVDWRVRPAPQAIDGFHVAVIGAGESGLGMGIKLARLGLRYTIFEKNPTVGGTWFENQYPGCGVDTPNHFYQYSFEPNHDWSRYFSPRDELWQYLERVADRYAVRPHIRFNTEVTEASWNDARGCWEIVVRDATGTLQHFTANALVCAVGQLNRPRFPDIEGLDRFAGPAMHTAQWDRSVALEGRRVAMIGTGASGMQVGPSIVDRVAQLSIFQRSPHWAVHNPLYHAKVEPGKKWALANLPHYASWYRFQLFWASADGLYPSLQVDPGWPTPNLSLNAENHAMRERLIEHIRAEVGDDPGLLAKTVPSYPPYGKRMLRDNGWFRMLRRETVRLITDPIEAIEPDGVRTRGGERTPADVLVLATGFQADRLTWPMKISGRHGVTLRERWGDDDPRAYLGITVPGFPNLFLMYGPNTNLAHGGSAIFHSECQTRYTLLALRELLERGQRALEVREDVHDEFNRRVDAQHAKMVWAHPGVGSWYKNRRGRVFATSPWRMLDYWNFTRVIEPSEYRFS
ncbi:MAG: flavin-containing monooxygenase [Burkholderiaceae bacterium]